MAEELRSAEITHQIDGLGARLAELRLAESLPEPHHEATLTVALTELESALDTLKALSKEYFAIAERTGPEHELRMAKTIFTEGPVPLFVLDRDATIRRANRRAAALIGTSPGYVAGKPFPIFCDLQTRVTLRSQLNLVFRTGESQTLEVTLLGKSGSTRTVLSLVQIWINGEADPLVVAGAMPISAGLTDPTLPPAPPVQESEALAVTQRMDVLAAVGEGLLSTPYLNESIAIRRCATLLATELADWVIIDVEHDGALSRQLAFGPDTEDSKGVSRAVEGCAPGPDTLPEATHRTGESRLLSHVEDIGVLGATDTGLPVCGLIGAHSLICVPIGDGAEQYGAITVASGGDQSRFDFWDLALVQRIGRYLGLVMRAGREFQRQTRVAEALQASLLPEKLPLIPGLDVAGRYRSATQDVTVGGDFYDAFPTKSAWALVLGDVSGKGERAAAVTAAARHGIRVLSRWKDDPAEVLTMVNETLLDSERFVTGVLAQVRAHEAEYIATVATAGHPPAIAISADGMVRATGGGGVPLGLFDDFEAAVETLVLAEGDTLLLYSDGVLDACDTTRERFGQERLIEVAAAHAGRPLPDMLAAVEQALTAFSDGGLADDISLLALRVQARSIS